jgi:hypothetical protein
MRVPSSGGEDFPHRREPSEDPGDGNLSWQPGLGGHGWPACAALGQLLHASSVVRVDAWMARGGEWHAGSPAWLAGCSWAVRRPALRETRRPLA